MVNGAFGITYWVLRIAEVEDPPTPGGANHGRSNQRRTDTIQTQNTRKTAKNAEKRDFLAQEHEKKKIYEILTTLCAKQSQFARRWREIRSTEF